MYTCYIVLLYFLTSNRRLKFNRSGKIACIFLLLLVSSMVYAREVSPSNCPYPQRDSFHLNMFRITLFVPSSLSNFPPRQKSYHGEICLTKVLKDHSHTFVLCYLD